MNDELVIGSLVRCEADDGGDPSFGIYLGQSDGYAKVAFPTGNIPLDLVSAVALEETTV